MTRFAFHLMTSTNRVDWRLQARWPYVVDRLPDSGYWDTCCQAARANAAMPMLGTPSLTGLEALFAYAT